jgi:hypothetical protein
LAPVAGFFAHSREWTLSKALGRWLEEEEFFLSFFLQKFL